MAQPEIPTIRAGSLLSLASQSFCKPVRLRLLQRPSSYTGFCMRTLVSKKAQLSCSLDSFSPTASAEL
jgi:hypothetical protein